MRWRSARRGVRREVQRVVDDAEVVLVVQEAGVGVDLRVDPDPELHVALELRRPRHRVSARAWAAAEQHIDKSEGPAARGRARERRDASERRVGFIYTPGRVRLPAQVQWLAGHAMRSARAVPCPGASRILTTAAARRFAAGGAGSCAGRPRRPPGAPEVRTASQFTSSGPTRCRIGAAGAGIGTGVALYLATNGTTVGKEAKDHGMTETRARVRTCRDGTSG